LELDFKIIPDKQEVLQFIDSLKLIFFPGLKKCRDPKIAYIKAKALYFTSIINNNNKQDEFFKKIEILKDVFMKDIQFTFEGDPACDAPEEIVSSYPGFTATFYYRIAHILYNQGFNIIARLISEEAHFLTGIDIHPGATIGEYFMIDHGTGVVIGETSVIGHHVKIYQGVTLGGVSTAKGQGIKGKKRQPTIGNYVTIYAGASILGGDVYISDNVVIGANVMLLDSVPENTKVTISKPKLIHTVKKIFK